MDPFVHAIRWQDQRLHLLDQRKLPLLEEWIVCESAQQAADAIREMVVRGAPAIGIAAAFGIALDALAGRDLGPAYRVLADSRPTAVNLHWALERLKMQPDQSAEALIAQAQEILSEDLQQNLKMAELGAALLPEKNARVLTHCNTGSLATGGHGTALGVIRTAWRQGRILEVFHTETRPWLQGARLTAWELKQESIPARMIADGAAAHLMRSQKIDWVIVGADRIAVNGDTANKIGTYALAVAAKQHGVKFMVVAPSGTFDPECPNGNAIPIEERGDTELSELQGVRSAPDGTRTWNPVFDVTPAELIDAIVNEKGVARPPDFTQTAVGLTFG